MGDGKNPPPRTRPLRQNENNVEGEHTIKKTLIYALALALALSLTACGQPNAEQPTDPAPSTSAPEPIATPEPIKDPVPEPEPEQTPAAPVETEDTQPPEETESQEDEVQLFTDVNETVYATGTVNLRNGAGTSFDKAGSLNKGDSVTRIGIGTAEAEGWSRIQLSNGNIVYVSNSYLSTTKPVVQQQQPGGGGQLQIQQPTQSSSQQQSQPSGGQSQEDKNRADNEAAGQGLTGMDAWANQHNTGENHPELRPGAIVDENGNITNPNTAVDAR